MSKIDSKEIYLELKKGRKPYIEEIHCPMILDVMNNEGTLTAFWRRALISETLFYNWTKEYPLFKECYLIGKVISKSNWEIEGEEGKDEEFFNFDLWRLKGSMRYGIGKNRVRMGVDAQASPYIQYQQLVEIANSEEFNASEIKQLMESINVGIRAYETFELQEQINKMQDDVNQIGARNVVNSNPIEKTTETD